MNNKELSPQQALLILLGAILMIFFLEKGIDLYNNYQNQQNIVQNLLQKQDQIESDAQAQEDATNSELQNIKNEAKRNLVIDDSSLVNKWSGNIVHIGCTNDSQNWNLGSGTITKMKVSNNSGPVYSGPVIVTNAHVVNYTFNGTVQSYTYCFFKVTGDSTLYTLDSTTFRYSADQDIAFVPIQSSKYPNVSFNNVTNIKICSKSGNIGEPLVILGYPQNGGTDGNITVTDGIVSSYDGQYYVTSAKVDHGNSGGAAILKNEDCYLGIPTWVETGSLESYARILDYSYIFSN